MRVLFVNSPCVPNTRCDCFGAGVSATSFRIHPDGMQSILQTGCCHYSKVSRHTATHSHTQTHNHTHTRKHSHAPPCGVVAGWRFAQDISAGGRLHAGIQLMCNCALWCLVNSRSVFPPLFAGAFIFALLLQWGGGDRQGNEGNVRGAIRRSVNQNRKAYGNHQNTRGGAGKGESG